MARTKRAGAYKSTSSAASSFSKAQKKTYAKMNRSNSARIATNKARTAALSRSTSRSSSSRGIPRATPQWQLFGGIGDAIRKATGGR